MSLCVEVLSETHGNIVLSELIHDHVVGPESTATFDNVTTYHLNEDGQVVMDQAIVTVMHVQDLGDATQTKKRKLLPKFNPY